MRTRVTRRLNVLGELRLLIEELFSDLLAFTAGAEASIDREVFLGLAGAFADLRVTAPGEPPNFVEVAFGLRDNLLLERVRRKYSTETPVSHGPGLLSLIVDTESRPGFEHLAAEVARNLRPGLKLEVWNEERARARFVETFGVSPGTFTVDELLAVRAAIERAKARHAFGSPELDPLKYQLLWHFGHERLKELGEARGRDLLPAGLYRSVVVLLADLCGFSSLVRDTRDDGVVRQSLTTFYSRARHQIHQAGGMLYQASGDVVLGFFGLPEPEDDAAARALAVARELTSIGTSVTADWQRQIDREQVTGGVHCALALGDVQLFALRPFDAIHLGAVGDVMNVVSELVGAAAPREIAITNPLYNLLDVEDQRTFSDGGTTETRRLGQLKHWKQVVTMAVVDGDETPSLAALDPVRMLSADYVDVVRLGQGGMGLVLRGVSRQDQSTVAIKVLAPNLAIDPVFVKRFMREVRALSLLSHPGIVKVVASKSQPTPHYVMEYVPWPDLRSRMTSPVPLPIALSIGAQLSAALAAAHAAGVVHRDVKPANVLVSPQHQVKLVDFGIATVEGETGVTATGQFIGTPRYMSPEQIDGGLVGAPADVFAVGLVLYEMLSGQPAFDPMDMRQRGTSAAPRLEPHPALDRALSDLVARCLDRSPAARPDATTLAAELSALEALLRA